METRHVLTSSDGHPIELFEWQPESGRALRGVVQIAHGMGEHALRYKRLAQALNNVGIAVYANEHRGHGEEALRRNERGELGSRGFSGLVDDMALVTDFAQTRHPGVPLVLLGHSMGSFAAQIYLLDHAHRLRAAALSGTIALDLAEAAHHSAWKNSEAKTPAEPAVARRTQFDWLSRDDAEVDAYIASALCGFRLQDRSRKTMYDGARHELLNETNRDEVTADFIAWVDRVLG